MRIFAFLFIGAVVVSSCSGEATKEAAPLVATAEEIAYAETAAPQDPALAAIYDRSCRTCHAIDGTGAPLAGQTGEWRARATARGADGLLVSAKNGFNAMPAMGLCADCSDDDLRALIAFMSSRPGQ